jgi:hypothetical protein
MLGRCFGKASCYRFVAPAPKLDCDRIPGIVCTGQRDLLGAQEGGGEVGAAPAIDINSTFDGLSADDIADKAAVIGRQVDRGVGPDQRLDHLGVGGGERQSGLHHGAAQIGIGCPLQQSRAGMVGDFEQSPRPADLRKVPLGPRAGVGM